MTLLAKSKLRTVLLATALSVAGAVVAQTVADDNPVPATGLDMPANLQIFGKVDPNVRKPTAIVNKTVDHRHRRRSARGADRSARTTFRSRTTKLQRLQGSGPAPVDRRDAADSGSQEAGRRRSSRKTSTQSVERVARNLNRPRAELATFLRSQRVFGSVAAAPDRRRTGLAARASPQGRAVRQRQRRRSERDHRALESRAGRRGISREGNLPSRRPPEQQQAVAARAQQIIDEIRKQTEFVRILCHQLLRCDDQGGWR